MWSHHKWEATLNNLTMYGRVAKCPYCISKNTKFCACQTVAASARLSEEWHPDAPITSADRVARGSNKGCLWSGPGWHPSFSAACSDRRSKGSGSPVCGNKRKGGGGRTHPVRTPQEALPGGGVGPRQEREAPDVCYPKPCYSRE